LAAKITISALREWMAEIGQRRRSPSPSWQVQRPSLQIVGLSFMLFRLPLLGLPIYNIGVVLTEIAGLPRWFPWWRTCGRPGRSLRRWAPPAAVLSIGPLDFYFAVRARVALTSPPALLQFALCSDAE